MVTNSPSFRQGHKIYSECQILSTANMAMTSKGGQPLGYGGGGDYLDLNGNGVVDSFHSIGGLSDRHQLRILEPQLTVPLAVLRQFAQQLGTPVLTAENLQNVQVQDIRLGWGGWSGPEAVASSPRGLASLLPVTGAGISFAIDLSQESARFLIYGPG